MKIVIKKVVVHNQPQPKINIESVIKSMQVSGRLPENLSTRHLADKVAKVINEAMSNTKSTTVNKNSK